MFKNELCSDTYTLIPCGWPFNANCASYGNLHMLHHMNLNSNVILLTDISDFTVLILVHFEHLPLQCLQE